jgi:hypothetical protein
LVKLEYNNFYKRDLWEIYMGIGRSIAFGIAGIGLFATLEIGALNLWRNYNVDYMDGDKRIIRKVDGLVSYTGFEVGGDGSVQMCKGKIWGGEKCFTDKDRDGRVDSGWIYNGLFVRGDSSESVCKEALERNTQKYGGINKVLAEEKKRFDIEGL